MIVVDVLDGGRCASAGSTADDAIDAGTFDAVGCVVLVVAAVAGRGTQVCEKSRSSEIPLAGDATEWSAAAQLGQVLLVPREA